MTTLRGARTYDLFEARAARDEGMAEVTRPKFAALYLQYCTTLEHGLLVTGEDITRACQDQGIFPHHHNAWGAAANAAVRKGLLIDTGERRPMRLRTSHARKTPLYRVR